MKIADGNSSMHEQAFATFLFLYNLDLDPMTFRYELGPHSQEIHRMCKYQLSM